MSLISLSLPSISLPCSDKAREGITAYTTVADVPADVLRRAAQQSVYFSHEFLSALEKHNSAQLQFAYLVTHHEGAPTALACIQEVVTDLPQGRGLEGSRLLRLLFSCGRPSIRIQVLGNVFLSGQYGVAFLQPQHAKAAFAEVLRATRRRMGQGSRTCSVQAMLVKDFPEAELLTEREFRKQGYASAPFEPNMVLELRPEWTQFDHYLNSLKAKYRTKANKALKESAGLEVRSLAADEIEALLPQMHPLYEAVEDGEFRMASLNLATYVELKHLLPSLFHVQGYWHQGQLVGFMAAMQNKGALDAHYVGLDYALNRSLYIYQRILYDYIRLGIELGAQRVVFGRTATEIKSTVGAQPAELACHLRMRNPVVNMGLRSAARKLEPASPHVHTALKEPQPLAAMPAQA